MTVAFLVRGGPDSGFGHVYHSLSIARSLDDGVEPVFVTDSGTDVKAKFREQGYRVVTPTSGSLPAAVGRVSPVRVVFDLPRVAIEEIAAVREYLGADARLIAIGNRNENLPVESDRYCDVIVDFDIGTSDRPSGQFYDPETDTSQLVGLKYFVLRPEFYERAGMVPTTDCIERVLLLFGGSDPGNLTVNALDRLLAAGTTYEIDIVLGAGFTQSAALGSVYGDYPAHQDRITISHDVDDVAAHMLDTDVVVTAPGLTTMEALLLGRPTVAFYQNELQEAWSDYPFVYSSTRLSELPQLIDRAGTAFETLTGDLNLDFKEGKKQVLDAIMSEDEDR